MTAEETTEALEDLGLTMTVKAGGPPNNQFPESNRWTITLAYRGADMALPYYTGVGVDGEPSLADVVSSVVSDTRAGTMSFDEFCGDFGCDTDSLNGLNAYATWLACQRIGDDWRELLGSDDLVDEVAEIVEDY